MKELKTDYDGLVFGLKLAIIAPSDALSKKCVELADMLAAKMPAHKVKKAQAQALEELGK